jgi:hypothetical protein
VNWSLQRCGRPTKQGTPCLHFPVVWPAGLEPPRRVACHDHLLAEDARRLVAAKAVLAEAEAAREPSCWSWELPDEDLKNAVRAEWADIARMRVSLDDPETFGSLLMEAWHRERCAICGRTGLHLVTDHDHATGLERGLLCRSCNIAEGMNHGGVWRRYRERSPAVILGVTTRYAGAFADEDQLAGTYQPYEFDPWKNNPMRNVDL